jgi:hypothetical protein
MKRRIAVFGSVLALSLMAAVAVAVARERGRPADDVPAIGQTYVFVMDSSEVAAEVLERPRGGWVKVRLLERAGGCGAACANRPLVAESWINLSRVALIAAAPPGDEEPAGPAVRPGPAERPVPAPSY